MLNAVVLGIVSLGTPFGATQVLSFLLGNLAGRSWDELWLVLPWLVVGVPLALLCARPLNLLQLGDEVAEGLGLPVNRLRFGIIVLSAALVAAVVSVCGPIGFVALLSPHLARRLVGTTDARQVLPIAGLIGAFLLVVADMLARLVLFPIEMPVGGFTALIGGPLLLVVFNRPFKVRPAAQIPPVTAPPATSTGRSS